MFSGNYHFKQNFASFLPFSFSFFPPAVPFPCFLISPCVKKHLKLIPLNTNITHK